MIIYLTNQGSLYKSYFFFGGGGAQKYLLREKILLLELRKKMFSYPEMLSWTELTRPLGMKTTF